MMAVTPPAKLWYTSKTLWANAIALVALGVQLKTGWLASPEVQMTILGGANLILRMVTKQPVALWLLVVMLLSGCGLVTRNTMVAGSGAALSTVGTQFVQVSSAFLAGCHATPPTISAADCQAYTAFGHQFQAAYPDALSAWKIARSTNDSAAMNSAEATISQLAAQLATLASQVITHQGGK